MLKLINHKISNLNFMYLQMFFYGLFKYLVDVVTLLFYIFD